MQVQFRAGLIPCGFISVGVQFRRGSIPCGFYSINGNPNFVVLGAFKTILKGLGKRRDLHGHGLGQGVDNFLLSAYDIYL